MQTETSITLYNKYLLPPNGKLGYKKTVIKKTNSKNGATWHAQRVATASTAQNAKGEINLTDVINIRIPILSNFSEVGGKTYIEPVKWLASSDSEKDNHFTFQEGDFVVKGECDFEFSATNPIANLTKNYDNVVTIMSYNINDFGSKVLQHYYLGGK